MDLITRIHGYNINFSPVYSPVPNIFTLAWVFLFVGIIACFKNVLSKIIYWGLFGISFVMFLTNNIYYSFTSLFFTFNLLKMADEGSSYISNVILNTNPLIYLISVLIIVLAIIVFKKMPANNKFKFKQIFIVFATFIIVHTLTPFLLGSANSNLKWNTFNNPRNTYETFSDSNRSMKVSGLYEYTFRNFYITFLKPDEKISSEDETFLKNSYADNSIHESNEYTGIFKGKNLIFLQLEGMDDWMLTKKDTPKLYNLLHHSINFTNHYSMYNGGGSTFNSEFAVNTGFTTPLSYIENVYSLNTNTFPNTMAKLFKKNGYSVNAFHMNSGDFYSRNINYKSWGYDNYYGLIDVKKYSDNSYKLDRELILNQTFYDKMFKQTAPFVHYIITYSPHTPFTTEKEVGKMLAEEKYAGQTVPDLSEEECAQMAASETDNMVGLLIQALKDNGLYNNTVIVAYADHYLYTINDKSVLKKYKTTKNNLINHTNFFIWSNDVTPTEINEVTMQTNILPTVLNLFGIEFMDNYYLCDDALASDYKGFAFFPDYSWYDGNVYVENNEITNKGHISKTEFNTTNNKINDILRKNDLTLKYNYLHN